MPSPPLVPAAPTAGPRPANSRLDGSRRTPLTRLLAADSTPPRPYLPCLRVTSDHVGRAEAFDEVAAFTRCEPSRLPPSHERAATSRYPLVEGPSRRAYQPTQSPPAGRWQTRLISAHASKSVVPVQACPGVATAPTMGRASRVLSNRSRIFLISVLSSTPNETDVTADRRLLPSSPLILHRLGKISPHRTAVVLVHALLDRQRPCVADLR